MRVGAAHAKAVHRAPARPLVRRPVGQPVIHPERAGLEINRRVRRLISQRRRDLFVMQRQRGLGKARNPGCGVEMADIGLDRADPAKSALGGLFPVGLCQGRHLDRVAQIGAGAVALDVVNGLGGHIRRLQRGADRLRLTADRGRQISGLVGAIIVDGAALDHCPDMVAIGQRVLEPSQRDHARARAEHGALRPVVERMAMAIGAEDFVFLVKVPAPLRQFDGRPARQRHVAFTLAQRLAGIVDRDQRGGAGGLDVDAWPVQVEHMADAGRQEILVVAGVAQQEHAHVVDQTGVRADVEIEIAAHAAAGIDADGSGDGLGRVACILHRLPGGFQELPVLGVEDGRLFWREAKEIGVEPVEPVQRCRRAHIIRISQPVRAFARLQQRRVIKDADRFDPGFQILPEFRRRLGAWNMDGHADDGDVILFELCFTRCHGQTKRSRSFTSARLPTPNLESAAGGGKSRILSILSVPRITTCIRDTKFNGFGICSLQVLEQTQFFLNFVA